MTAIPVIRSTFMLHQRPRILPAAVFLYACLSTVSAAPTGRIFGRITDPSKAVVPGAWLFPVVVEWCPVPQLSLGEVLLVDRAGHRVLRVHDVGDLDHSALAQELVGVHFVVSVVFG